MAIQRTRRTPEQRIADLEKKIEQVRRRAEQRKAKRDPTLKYVAGAVELTGLIGYYAMVALMLNAADLPLPADMPSLPPRG